MTNPITKKYSFFLSALFILMLVISCNKEEVKYVGNSISPEKLLDLGTEQWQLGNYQQALENYNVAYKKFRSQNNQEEMATLLNNLGLVHWSLRNNKDAMECYNESAKIAERLGMKRLLGLTHTNRSLLYKQKEDFDKAFSHNNKAIALFKGLDEPRDLAIAYNNQGQLYRYTKKPDDALKYYWLSVGECQKIDYPTGYATAWQNIATVNSTKGNTADALSAARKALGYSIASKSKVRISEAYMELSVAFEKMAKADSALYYYKMHDAVQNEILEANQSERLSQNQAELSVAVKNLRIKNLQHQQQLANDRLWFIGIIIFSILSVGLFFVYRHFSRNNIRRQQLEAELNTSHRLIEVKEQELRSYIIGVSRSSMTEPLPKIPADEITAITEHDIAALLDQKILTDDDWETFKTRFKCIYPGFFHRIKQSRIALTEAETRLLVLMRLELNGKDMANILGISPQSVRVCKMRLKKRLPAEQYSSVEDFLADLTGNKLQTETQTWPNTIIQDVPKGNPLAFHQ